MKFAIKNRHTGSALFEAEIECAADASHVAAEARACLADAYLVSTDLVDIDLDIDLADADKEPLDVPVVPNIDAAILAAIEAGGTLDMDSWHSCETTHCRAGWAIHLAGDAGYELERKVGSQKAGALIYSASRPGQPVPCFFVDDEVAMDDLRRCALEQISKEVDSKG